MSYNVSKMKRQNENTDSAGDTCGTLKQHALGFSFLHHAQCRPVVFGGMQDD